MKKGLMKGTLSLLLGILFMFTSDEAAAQLRSRIDVQEWPNGMVVLTTGDTLRGPIAFYRKDDVINVLHSDGTVSALSPVNVQYFIAQDSFKDQPHVFVSLMWDQGKDYSNFKRPTFFEQLSPGNVTLVMREAYVQRDISRSSRLLASSYYYDPYYYSGSQMTEEVRELYYLLMPDGNVLTLRKTKRDLLRAFGNKASQVKTFVKNERLSYDRPTDLVSILEYYNGLN
ncbi:hypothetical protein [Pontibacter harenae]|uniref:hypothetical protein n=1 Tax=Pontibacter harenae TaxID=2894083 RepID=UPI001E56A6E1|nr:hypothetical protein [Pontibacter harenae]MCC9166175.1 hypothetical protein [Pontibacter harenae]